MTHINSQKNTKQVILLLEENYPVNQWRVNGVDVWPYIRIKLYYALLNPTSDHKEKINDDLNDEKIKPPKKILTFFKLCVGLVRLKIFFLKLKPKKILFFGAHFHRVNINGLYFNRFYDSMIKYHGLEFDVYMLEYLKVYKNSFNKKSVLPLSEALRCYKHALRIKPSENQENKVSLKKYKLFCDELEEIKLSPTQLGILETDIVNWVNKILILKPFFSKIYSKSKTLKVVFLGYYGYDDLYAALFTANTLKIKTIDFQHGPQTNVHMAFSNWSKLPKKGFNTMPKTFWNWDENSKKNIEDWAISGTGIKAKVVGQPYLAYNNLNLSQKNIADDKKTILYSLQTSPLELFTPAFINLIKLTSFTWILRLHPRNDESIENIKKFLKKNEIKEKCIIQDSIGEPLPLALKKSFLHITNYSGCTLEAILLGVPTLLVHEVGKEMFENYIDNHLVYYLDQNTVDFIKKFKKVINCAKNKKKPTLRNNRIFNPLVEKF